MKGGSRNAASIVGAIGKSGSGKSLWMKQRIRALKPVRLLIWDPQDEYAGFGSVFSDRKALLLACVNRPAFACVYRPGDDQRQYEARFDWFCRLAYTLGNLLLVVDELGDVTQASRAPAAWSMVSRKGRHMGLSILAGAQSPAIIDKRFLGGCTLIHCSKLILSNDIDVMAKVLGVPGLDISSLAADPAARSFEWIERDMATGAITRGKLRLPT